MEMGLIEVTREKENHPRPQRPFDARTILLLDRGASLRDLGEPAQMTHKELLENEARNHFNEIVLCHLSLFRMVGFHEDSMDYYYRLKPVGYGRPESLTSCVGGFVVLKGKIDDSDYTRLENLFGLSGCPPESEWTSEIEEDA